MSGITNKSRIVIYGWMINELDIYNTDELIIYAPRLRAVVPRGAIL